MIQISSSVDFLIGKSSPPLGGEITGSSELFRSLLAKKNGFYAFLSALFVYPSCPAGSEGSLEWWNGQGGWKEGYGDHVSGFMSFASDAFGGQFLLRDGVVSQFNPETGGFEGAWDGIEGWASAIIEEPEYLTGYPLAEAWQRKNGPLAPGFRLAPKTPFVLGGDFSVENLYAMRSIDLIKMQSRLANKVKNIPDGGKMLVFLEDGSER